MTTQPSRPSIRPSSPWLLVPLLAVALAACAPPVATGGSKADDGRLYALDARTGRLLWETQVVDTMSGYTITSPPLALRDKIITGVSGGGGSS